VDPGIVTMFMLENVAVLVWFQQPTAESIDRVDQRLASLRAGQGPALTMVHVIKSPLQLPDDASRAGMLHVMRAHDVSLVVMVVKGSSFMLSMMRSVITGLRVLTAGRFDYRIDDSIESVATWLPQQHRAKSGVQIDSQRLNDVLRTADALQP
jgi:hypothetical protein